MNTANREFATLPGGILGQFENRARIPGFPDDLLSDGIGIE